MVLTIAMVVYDSTVFQSPHNSRLVLIKTRVVVNESPYKFQVTAVHQTKRLSKWVCFLWLQETFHWELPIFEQTSHTTTELTELRGVDFTGMFLRRLLLKNLTSWCPNTLSPSEPEDSVWSGRYLTIYERNALAPTSDKRVSRSWRRHCFGTGSTRRRIV
jgi:hypothetical protein